MSKIKQYLSFKELTKLVAVVILGLGAAQCALMLRDNFRPNYSEGNYLPYIEHYGAQTPNAQPVVVMFGTAWCPYCANARKYFSENKIPFVDIDVEKDQEAKRHFQQIGRGFYPLVLIGNRAISGFHPDEYQEAISLASK